MGKVFHPRSSSNNDDPPSWTTPYYHSIHRDGYFLPKDSVGGWFSVPKSEIDKIPLVDMVSTEMAKVILTDMSLTTTTTTTTTKRPFFMAVGFNKPHLSMVCPEEFYDKYPLEEEERFLVNTSWHKPLVRPSVNIDGIQTEADERILPPDALRDLRRAYFACISYVDDLVGQILRKLEETGLDKSTIVSFMADHGFHLGENRHWGKVTTWELSNRVPMMIRIPGLTDAGIVSPSVVESVDMFPTLVEAAGLEPLPVCPKRSGSVPLCTQGISLMPLLRKPKERVQSAAFSQIVATDGMRYTIRTGRHRLVETALVYNVSQPNGSYQISVEWQSTMDRIELYDHEMDILEQVNLINDRRYADVVEDLRERLHEFVESLIG
ncbi:hypothetical protein LSH36_258g00002 [Paralvinella palmiformis]|uniref:Sulfatase N-terminal domain-containing protein n=1 Tax=Paralvinella palmiformis TaxID=53620 RepID=A0AAD9N2I0_9ANNE|nr:hypothetical protein LSH36_258g00002 [Paralvinella palmiformis]